MESPNKKQKTQEGPVYHHSIRWSVQHTTENRDKFQKWLRNNCDKFIFQAEDTVNNPHYQGYCHTVIKNRSTTLARGANDDLRGVDIRPASTNGLTKLKTYCMKDETRVDGPWADKRLYLGQDLWPIERWPDWQRSLFEKLQSNPDDRTLRWIYDPLGQNGKSKFLKYLSYKWDSLALGYGHSVDTLNLVSKFPNKQHYGFNLTRCKPSNISELDLYAAMESIKDGHFINLKYETAEIIMCPPHVTVFANHLPKMHMVSLDRWKIFEIENHQLIERE